MPVWPVGAIHATDERVRLQPTQDHWINGFWLGTDPEVDGGECPEKPVAVPVRDMIARDPLETRRRVIESHHHRREATTRVWRRQDHGTVEPELSSGPKPVQAAPRLAGRHRTNDIGMRNRALLSHPLKQPHQEPGQDLRVDVGCAG